jgi:ABC-type branched-subunit amino acid transport system substrate-binding protein
MVIAFQSVIPYLVDRGVPLIQGGAENQTSDALSPVNFATAPSGSFYGRFLAVLAARHLKVRRIGLTFLDVPSETNGLPVLRREMEREGVEIVAEEPVDAAEEAVTNMDSVVTRMRAAGAEGVIAINPVVLIFGRLAARRQEWGVPWGGLAAWSALVEEGCGATCDDVVTTDTAGLSYVDRDSPQMRQFLDTMRRRYPGGQLTGHTLAAWVGMQLTVEMLGRAGGPDRRAFVDALHQVRNLDLGTTSPLTFTPDRHLGGSATVLIKLRDGRYYRASEPLSYGEAEVGPP